MDITQTQTASDIVKTLVKNKKPMKASELKEVLSKDWNTIRTNLTELEKSGRVHVAYIGNNKYFALNGKEKFQDKIPMSDSSYLWLDIFEPNDSINEHFIRIKQTRRKSLNEWEAVGTLTITPTFLTMFIQKLENLKDTLEKEYSSRDGELDGNVAPMNSNHRSSLSQNKRET